MKELNEDGYIGKGAVERETRQKVNEIVRWINDRKEKKRSRIYRWVFDK